jgi:RNA polymerase sigma-70 factor (family 1)
MTKSDSDLLSEIKAGNTKAFDSLFIMYFIPLCSYATKFVETQANAEDLVEDFFCDFWINRKSININTSIKSYLFRSVHNRGIDYVRRQKIMPGFVEHRNYFIRDKELLEPSTPAYTIANLISQEIVQELTVAIDSLPEQCKKVFCLSRFDGLKYEEISRKLNISINTVKTQMSKALKLLRFKLEKYLPAV